MTDDLNKKLLSDFKINCENIYKININISEELEKRMAFSEECAKILLNQNVDKNNESNIEADFSFFTSLIENEKSKINFSTIKKNIIDENIFLCEYIFKSIIISDLFSAYSVYIAENPMNSIDLNGLNLNKTINLKIDLTDRISFNDFLQYLSLFNFDIINFSYDCLNNSVGIKFKIPGVNIKDKDKDKYKEKEKIFAAFYGLPGYYGIKINIVQEEDS